MKGKIYQHESNLVQNFYIIGLNRNGDTLVSSILSKYPPKDFPYMSSYDEVIVNVSKKIINRY